MAHAVIASKLSWAPQVERVHRTILKPPAERVNDLGTQLCPAPKTLEIKESITAELN